MTTSAAISQERTREATHGDRPIPILKLNSPELKALLDEFAALIARLISLLLRHSAGSYRRPVHGTPYFAAISSYLSFTRAPSSPRS